MREEAALQWIERQNGWWEDEDTEDKWSQKLRLDRREALQAIGQKASQERDGLGAFYVLKAPCTSFFVTVGKYY